MSVSRLAERSLVIVVELVRSFTLLESASLQLLLHAYLKLCYIDTKGFFLNPFNRIWVSVDYKILILFNI